MMLVLGFEPYGGHAVNPSQRLAEALDGRRIGGRRVRGDVLPVRYDTLHSRVEALLREHRPSAVVAFGLRPGESAICLERTAFNRNDFDLADNAGARECGAVRTDEPERRTATLPVAHLRAALLRRGIPARISDDAGRFLCNALMYSLLSHAEALEPAPPAGFVHLPYLPEQIATMLGSSRADLANERCPTTVPASMSLELAIRAAETLVEETLGAFA